MNVQLSTFRSALPLGASKNFQLSTIHSAAHWFAQAMQGRTIFAFDGKMGAGKTTFIKAVCRELGVTDDTVASPTFAIVNEYEGREGAIYHFDFYRLRQLSEACDMGCEDYFYSGRPCFIEWPDIVSPLLPPDTVHVRIEEQPDGSRTVALSA